MLGLDKLSEALVDSLAAASGVESPSPEGSAAEAKELAALASLISLASSREAGFLGSGWVTVLRTLSSLDLLKVGFLDERRIWISFPLCDRLCSLQILLKANLRRST